MALPDYIRVTQGTPIIWGESGAAGVTNTISIDGLADGSARMGAEADLGSSFRRRYRVELWVETGTAPTAGNRVDLYLTTSYDGTNYPAGVTGSDGAWPSDGNEDEWAPQLEYIGSLIATNDGNTVQMQSGWIWECPGRYVVPVIDNNLGVAFRDETTATDNGTRIILTPLDDTVED